MRLGDVFTLKEYSDYYEFAIKNGLTIKEISGGISGEREFKLVELCQPNQEDESQILRGRRELECFSVINRGRLWYDNLTSEQLDELAEWYRAWLDVTDTRIVPEKPNWIN